MKKFRLTSLADQSSVGLCHGCTLRLNNFLSFGLGKLINISYKGKIRNLDLYNGVCQDTFGRATEQVCFGRCAKTNVGCCLKFRLEFRIEPGDNVDMLNSWGLCGDIYPKG